MSEVTLYMGTSLIGSRRPLGPCSRPAYGPTVALGGVAPPYEGGSSVELNPPPPLASFLESCSRHPTVG